MFQALIVPTAAVGLVCLASSFVVEPAMAEPAHGIAMHGAPKYAADFSHLDYVNPAAPVGGRVNYAATGSFDTLNPNVIQGQPATGVRQLLYETLLKRVWDEPFTLYGLIAETVEMAPDRSWVAFTLREEAHFNDGSPITIDDIIFSWETIRTQGRPNSRTTFNKVTGIERTGPRSLRFNFADGADRELPLLIGGFLPILSQAYWQANDFTATSLTPPVTSGPYLIDAIDPGRSITYRRDADYWGRDLAINKGQHNIETIHYDYYRDADVALEAFKASAYDFRYEFDPSRWATQYDFPALTRGEVILETVAHGIPSGLKGFAFNIRQAKFTDRRVREAFGLALDFARLNRVLLHSSFVRTASMFDNSDLSPRGLPSNAELMLLAPWWGQVPDAVFDRAWAPPETDGSGDNRTNLRRAQALLAQAGWTVRDGALVDADGVRFEVEIMLVSPDNEAVSLAYAEGLERLGVAVSVVLVESAQYQARLEDFDFDMAIRRWGVTLSPGNEQQNYWSSATANAVGSRNSVGVADPAIDALIEALVGARFRTELVTAARALDRLLMWNFYVVPMWHQSGFRLARWRRIAHPETVPIYGLQEETFWAVGE